MNMNSLNSFVDENYGEMVELWRMWLEYGVRIEINDEGLLECSW